MSERPSLARCTYAPGDRKRAKILEAAVAEFGRSGFEGASTRAIALRAGVPLTSLQYYFGSKNRLFEACDDFVVRELSGRLYPALLPFDTQIRKARPDKVRAREGIHQLINTLADLLLSSKKSAPWVEFVLRSEQGALRACPKLTLLKRKVLGCLTELIAVALDLSPNDSGARIRAVAVYGSVLIFRISEAVALDVIGWKEFGSPRAGIVAQVVNNAIDAEIKQT